MGINQSQSWPKCSDSVQCESIVRNIFGPTYSFARWPPTMSGAQAAVLQDEQFGLEWVLAPGGTFHLGFTEDERAAALKLSPRPLLNF